LKKSAQHITNTSNTLVQVFIGDDMANRYSFVYKYIKK
jgi:hypothetical protein